MSFRYQVQYKDAENGIYISQDPIGMASEKPNLYPYVDDVNSWIDPLGLAELIALFNQYSDGKGNFHYSVTLKEKRQV